MFLLRPLAGRALTLLCDEGRRKGNLANSLATFDEDVANDRQLVLVAFREVEDNFQICASLTTRPAFGKTRLLLPVEQRSWPTRNIQDGAIGYLYVINADRSVLQS
jgi:multidrug efflux system outer membrane protein